MALWDGRNASGNPDTGPTVDLNLLREPWRCQKCGLLIHNLKKGYPSPGAPMPKVVSAEFDKLCTMCAEMYWTISARIYWIELHRKWVELQKNVKKLKPGEDYFK